MVEDFEPYRGFVKSLLLKSANLRLIGEAVDGIEAVDKAEELKPDLVLMDIGLPRRNGIEAARLILEATRRPKIIFLTQETSFELVQEALALGASGYVFKSQAKNELLGAIEAVLQNKRFVSGGLDGHKSVGANRLDPER